MKAEEIRSKVLRNVHHIPPEHAFELEVLQEIAAQLADLNQHFSRSAEVKPRTTFTEAVEENAVLRTTLQEARDFIVVVDCDEGLTTENLIAKIDAALKPK